MFSCSAAAPPFSTAPSFLFSILLSLLQQPKTLSSSSPLLYSLPTHLLSLPRSKTSAEMVARRSEISPLFLQTEMARLSHTIYSRFGPLEQCHLALCQPRPYENYIPKMSRTKGRTRSLILCKIPCAEQRETLLSCFCFVSRKG